MQGQVIQFLPDHVETDGTVWCCAEVIVVGGQARLAMIAIPYHAFLSIASLGADTPYSSPQVTGMQQVVLPPADRT